MESRTEENNTILAENKPKIKRNPVGLGGWLVVFQIFIFLLALGQVITLAFEIRIFTYGIFTGWKELMLNTYWIVIFVFLFIQFYRKHMVFRSIYTVILIPYVIYAIKLIIQNRQYGINVWQMFYSALLLYFPVINVLIMTVFLILLYNSKRVNNTFS